MWRLLVVIGSSNKGKVHSPGRPSTEHKINIEEKQYQESIAGLQEPSYSSAPLSFYRNSQVRRARR